MTGPESLYAPLQAAIVRSLATDTLSADDIGVDTVLFEEGGLGLDSVDALEIAFEIEETFGVEIPDDDAHRAVFTSVRTLAAHVFAHRAAEGGVDRPGS